MAHCTYAAAPQPAQGAGKNTRVPKKMPKISKSGAQKWVRKMDPKMGLSFGPTIRILLKPDFEAQFWVPKTGPKMGPKIEQKNNETKTKKGRPREPKKGPTHESLSTWNSLSPGSTLWLVFPIAACK